VPRILFAWDRENNHIALYFIQIVIDIFLFLSTIIKDFHLRPLPPFKHRHLDVPLDLDKIITIIGPRRAGKMWYLFQLIANLEKANIKKEQILYLNFEDDRLNFDAGYDLILDAYLELYPEQKLEDLYIFFDEIQEIPEWEKYEPAIVKREMSNKKIYLYDTGIVSAALYAF